MYFAVPLILGGFGSDFSIIYSSVSVPMSENFKKTEEESAKPPLNNCTGHSILPQKYICLSKTWQKGFRCFLSNAMV